MESTPGTHSGGDSLPSAKGDDGGSTEDQPLSVAVAAALQTTASLAMSGITEQHVPHETLLAAAELFIQDGSQSVDCERLTKHFQGSPPSFANTNAPRDLLVAIFRYVWRQINAETRAIIDKRDDPRDTISNIFANIFDLMLYREERLGRCIIIESHRYDREKIRQCFMIPEFLGVLEMLQAYVDEQVRTGNLLPINTSAIVELFLSIQDGMMFAWTIEKEFGYPTRFRREDFETVIRLLVSALFLPSTEQSKTYYDSVAMTYDSLYTDGISLAENAIVGDMIAAHVKHGMHVLDLGCGTGLGYELLARRIGYDFDYNGVDISPEMIMLAKRRFVAVTNAQFMVMNIEDLSYFKTASFDFCFSLFGSFSHVLNPGPAISELRRILKPGGTLLLMLYSRFSWKNIFETFKTLSFSRLAEVRPYEIRKTSGSFFADARFYTKTSIEEHFSCFSEINVKGLNCWLELPWSKSRFRDSSRTAAAREFLLAEMERLSVLPNRCHSLIVQGRKHA